LRANVTCDLICKRINFVEIQIVKQAEDQRGGERIPSADSVDDLDWAQLTIGPAAIAGAIEQTAARSPGQGNNCTSAGGRGLA
jgi:hypothetical protein